VKARRPPRAWLVTWRPDDAGDWRSSDDRFRARKRPGSGRWELRDYQRGTTSTLISLGEAIAHARKLAMG